MNLGPLTGTKKFTVHYGLESSWASKGPKDTKASYGPKYVVGHTWPKVKWAGVIFDGPHDVVGPISFRA